MTAIAYNAAASCRCAEPILSRGMTSAAGGAEGASAPVIELAGNRFDLVHAGRGGVETLPPADLRGGNVERGCSEGSCSGKRQQQSQYKIYKMPRLSLCPAFVKRGGL